jgi:hypothetical protein
MRAATRHDRVNQRNAKTLSFYRWHRDSDSTFRLPACSFQQQLGEETSGHG